MSVILLRAESTPPEDWASGAVGHEAAKTLAKHGATVILACKQ
jgi:hypothetical protein